MNFPESCSAAIIFFFYFIKTKEKISKIKQPPVNDTIVTVFMGNEEGIWNF